MERSSDGSPWLFQISCSLSEHRNDRKSNSDTKTHTNSLTLSNKNFDQLLLEVDLLKNVLGQWCYLSIYSLTQVSKWTNCGSDRPHSMWTFCYFLRPGNERWFLWLPAEHEGSFLSFPLEWLQEHSQLKRKVMLTSVCPRRWKLWQKMYVLDGWCVNPSCLCCCLQM